MLLSQCPNKTVINNYTLSKKGEKMIDVDMINARREELVEDLNKVRLRQEEIEKARLENVALQNALTGAVQQCDDFLNKLNNEESDDSFDEG